MDRAAKKELVATLNKVFTNTGSRIVVTHNLGPDGLADEQICAARWLRRVQSLKVAKNRLAKLALEGTDAEGIKDLFAGPTVLMYSDDPVAAPKVVAEVRQEERETRHSGRLAGYDRPLMSTVSRHLPSCRLWMNSGPRSSA